MPLLSNSINAKTTAKKNGSQNQNQVVLVSGVPQKSNTMRFRLPRQISQEIAGEKKYAYDLVMLKAAQSLQHIDLFTIVVFVYQIFASFPQTKTTQSSPE